MHANADPAQKKNLRRLKTIITISLQLERPSPRIFPAIFVLLIAKRKQQRRPRQADAFLFRPSVPRFDHLVSVRA
jgi:hypothetical protein